MSPWVPALEGQTLAGYYPDNGSYLGGGAFGLVFEVTEVSTSSRYAMKILVPGDPKRQRSSTVRVFCSRS